MTVEKICWIVGVHLGTMHESQEAWAKKVMGPDRSRRACQARNVVAASLYESCGVSYTEIGMLLGKRHESVIGRAIKWTRKWITESTKNEEAWQRIDVAIKETIAAEQRHHAEVENIRISGKK